MTDSEKLDLALSKLDKLDILESDMHGLKQDMQGMQQEMQGMKQDIQELKPEMQGLKQDMQEMKQDMQELKPEMQGLKQNMHGLKQDIQEIKRRTTNLELHIENVTDKNIQLIAENFIELTKKLNEAIPAADKNLAYEVKVNYLVCEIDKIKKDIEEIKNKIA